MLSWVCLLSPLHGIWATTRQRTPESRGAIAASCRRSGAERWPGYIQQPSGNHGLTGGFRHVWEKKGGALYYRGMATCKSYPSSNDHAGFSSCVSSWLVKMLTWRKRSNDDLFKFMISIIHCCYTLIPCGLHKTFLYSLVTSTCWYFIGRTWILLIYSRNGRTCHFGRALQSLGPRRIGTTFRQKQSSSATPHFSPLDVDLRHALPDGHVPKMVFHWHVLCHGFSRPFPQVTYTTPAQGSDFKWFEPIEHDQKLWLHWTYLLGAI